MLTYNKLSRGTDAVLSRATQLRNRFKLDSSAYLSKKNWQQTNHIFMDRYHKIHSL